MKIFTLGILIYKLWGKNIWWLNTLHQMYYFLNHISNIYFRNEILMQKVVTIYINLEININITWFACDMGIAMHEK